MCNRISSLRDDRQLDVGRRVLRDGPRIKSNARYRPNACSTHRRQSDPASIALLERDLAA